jgi:4-amino-4-deoxy-L-arabinose transferase-like glycosyltransferase
VTSRESERPDVLYGIGLFLVAFVLRFRVALALAAEPVWDGHYYDFGAKRIAAGLGYSDDITLHGERLWHPWCHYPVGYSAYLAAFYKLFGTAPWVAHLADSLVGALLAVFTFLLAREALGPVRARVAGGLVAIHPGLVLYGALVMSEPLAALLVMVGFWTAIRVDRSRAAEARWWLGPAVGALILGVSALVRPQSLLCVPLLAIVPGCAGARRRIGGAALACALAFVPIMPWTARNCRVMDSCALVSTNGGWNLAIGSFPRATGRFETLRSSDGCREVTGQVQQDRCWLAYGVANIKEHPMRWLALVPAKLGYTFDQESFAVEYLHEAEPEAWPEQRRVAMRGVTTDAHRILVAAAALGFVGFAVRRRKRRAAIVQTALLGALALGGYAAFAADTPTFWPIALVACALPWVALPGRPKAHAALLMPAGFIATVAVTHAIFFGEDRYHVVVTPALCLLAAAALRPPADLQNTRGANT